MLLLGGFGPAKEPTPEVRELIAERAEEIPSRSVVRADIAAPADFSQSVIATVKAPPPPPPPEPEPEKAAEPAKVENHSAPGGIAACIRKYESGGNYRAQNPVSSASGAYQFIDGTWRSITGRSDRAKDAPPAVQDAAFYKLWANGAGARHWVTAHKCGY